MDKKILAVVAVVVVVAAAASAYVLLNNNNDGEKTDYTLLDKLDDVKAGFVYKVKTDSMIMGYKVDKVENNVYYVTTTMEEKINDDDFLNSHDLMFTPNGFKYGFGFDYTSSTIPEGVTVKVSDDGKTYTINGKWTFEDAGSVRNSEASDLAITLDETGDVAKVNGKVKYGSHNGKYNTTYDVTLTAKDDGKVEGKGTEVDCHSNEVSLSEFKSLAEKYKASKYEGTTITESTEKCGNVDAKVYTINGTDDRDNVYENFKIYTYHDYVIKMDGKEDNEVLNATLYIYYE